MYGDVGQGKQGGIVTRERDAKDREKCRWMLDKEDKENKEEFIEL